MAGKYVTWTVCGKSVTVKLPSLSTGTGNVNVVIGLVVVVPEGKGFDNVKPTAVLSGDDVEPTAVLSGERGDN